MIDPPPDQILWCYSEYQAAYDELKQVEFIDGLPDTEKLNPALNKLVVLDDFMGSFDSKISDLFTKKSHHQNLSVVYIVQNLFHKGKAQRTISLNSHYLVLFKNVRDASQIKHLSRQMFPSKSKYLEEAYVDATKEPFGYLLIDLKQNTPDDIRLRTHIFPDERTIAYVSKR